MEVREIARLMLPHRHVVQMMSLDAAKAYIDRIFPDLDGSDLEYALSLAGKRIPPKQAPRAQDPLFCAAMFLAGVSLGDLALLFGIQKPTVVQKIARRLSPTERKENRDQLPHMDLEVLAMCRTIFNAAIESDPNSWEGIYPLEIGRALISSANAAIAVDRGEEPAIKRPRRYSQMNQPSGKEVASEMVAEAHKLPEMAALEQVLESPQEEPMNKKGQLAPLTDLNAPQRIKEQDKVVKHALDDFMKDLDAEAKDGTDK